MTVSNSGVTERFKHLEIEINTSCDMNCVCCDRLVDQAPGPSMTVAQIQRFVDESLELNWEWTRIHILGGEPTLHPQFREIVEVLKTYREKYPSVLLRVISNGHGKLSLHKEWILDNGIVLNVETKYGVIPPYFRNVLNAPIDQGSPEIIPPCSIFGISGCGIGLTRHGYFLCGAGAALARVSGLDIGIQRLADLTYDEMLDQSMKLCVLCGHHKDYTQLAVNNSEPSAFWKKRSTSSNNPFLP